MPTQKFIFSLEEYHFLSKESINRIKSICKIQTVAKGEIILDVNDVPKYFFFVDDGLFSYYYLADNGDKVIKKFFTENTFMASLSASIVSKPSQFAVEALADGSVVKIPVQKFKTLIAKHHDIALLYIQYVEKNWVLEKEVSEIKLKYDDAAKRFQEFIEKFPNLYPKLRQHHIASFLGITPTQLSRILKKIKHQHM